MVLSFAEAWARESGQSNHVSFMGLRRILEPLQNAWPSLPWTKVVSIRHAHGCEAHIGCPIPATPLAGTEASGSTPGRKTGVVFQDFHVTWILLRLLAVHVDETIMSGPQPWTHELQALMEYVCPILCKPTGMSVTDLSEDQGTQDIAAHVCALIAEHLGVDTDVDMLRLDLGACVPGSAPPSLALTYVIVWSNLLVPVLGTGMLRRLQTKVLQYFGAPIQDGSRDLADTRQELVNVLKARRWQSQGLGRALGLQEEDPRVRLRI